MDLEILIVIEARKKAIKVRIGEKPYPAFWIPRSAIRWGEQYRAGDRDQIIDVATWMYNQIQQGVSTP